MPYHILLDEYEEERLGKNAFGSTKSGIAPFFSDKYAKIGIQVNELFDDETLKAKLKNICTLKILLSNMYITSHFLTRTSFTKLALNTERRLLLTFAIRIHIFKTHLKRAKTFSLRVSSVHLMDPDFGIYPMVTSSSTLAGYGAVGAGLPLIQSRYSLLLQRLIHQQ